MSQVYLNQLFVTRLEGLTVSRLSGMVFEQKGALAPGLNHQRNKS